MSGHVYCMDTKARETARRLGEWVGEEGNVLKFKKEDALALVSLILEEGGRVWLDWRERPELRCLWCNAVWSGHSIRECPKCGRTDVREEISNLESRIN